MNRSFTLVLTKGRYVVSEADAERVLKSVQDQDAHVLVRADMLGDGLVYSPVRIVVSHVIAVVENDASATAGPTIRPKSGGSLFLIERP